MKRTIFLIILIVTSFIILSNGTSYAITVTASPNPAMVNHNVLVNINSSYSSLRAPSCVIEVNFGDGFPFINVGTCTTFLCSLSTSHIYTTPGIYTITARSRAGSCLTPPLPPDPAITSVTVQCANLTITSSPNLPSGTVWQAYSFQIQTSGGQAPITYNLISGSLPPGLSLSSTGLISGTPTTPGSYSFTIRASDSCPSGSQTALITFSLQINPSLCVPLNIISSSTLPSGTIGQVYLFQLQTSGGSPPIIYSLVSGSLPPGLSLSPTGLISGTPATSGNYSFTVRAMDSCQAGAQSVERTFTIQVQALPVTISVNPVPSSFSVPRGQSSAAGVNYLFTGTSSLTTTLNSSSGNFMVGSEPIEINPLPLTVNIQNGSGQVSEVISIPVRVLERTIQRGVNRFIYTRTFISPNINLTAILNFTITTEAGADFGIRRIELYFDNRRPEITVERNYPNLKAYADISFVGSGLLQGFWEVDGRILSHVDQHLTFGGRVTFQTPEIPLLPTYDTGTHVVRFVITNPVTEMPLPSIIYFVTPAEFKGKPIALKLISPENDSMLEYLPIKFEWEKFDKTALFLIQFYDNLNSNPIFSAYTRGTLYLLPEAVLKNIFSPGQKYYWKVMGFDAENNVICESKIWSFSFKNFAMYVPGQILTVFTESAFSENLLNELRDAYKIKSIDSFSLKSVNLNVVLFETMEKDIFKVIDALKKDKRILVAQPNFILRTMSDPLRKMQYANDIMKIDKIHTSYRGRGMKVAVVDTGVDAGHIDLKDRVIITKNFMRGENYSPEIHGTSVAGIIAASINGSGIEGVAPESRILSLRACKQTSKERPEGECFTDSLSKALDEAIVQKVNIVNMSFGATQHDSLFSKIIDRGVQQGILFIAPAGNFKNERELRFPASHPSVISVGGFDEKLNPYPNPEITKKTLVCASATNIITTVPGNKHNFISGTSMSSAYISGILALALEKDKSINKEKLPVYKGDICKWEEELLKISICGK